MVCRHPEKFCHSLRLYYVGYGANQNKTARFRRYTGDGKRPLLPEHDLKRRHLPNRERRVQIISTKGEFKYLIDGELVFDVEDSEPYTQGWFGFRTVRNHMTIDNFRVYRISRAPNAIHPASCVRGAMILREMRRIHAYGIRRVSTDRGK